MNILAVAGGNGDAQDADSSNTPTLSKQHLLTATQETVDETAARVFALRYKAASGLDNGLK